MKHVLVLKSFFFIVISFYIIGCSENEIIVPTDDSILESNIGTTPIEPFYPVPTKMQLEWQNSELAMFIHFGINTFTGKEWGDGTENPADFNPKKLDAEQWVRTARDNGFKYVILTAKHHDGFCLWPSNYTEHSIKNSPYKNGKGDIVKEFAEACRKFDVKFGFYLSPWDRHESTYGTDAYNQYFQKQLIELLTNYGKVGEIWFDGANGEGPNGKKQEYNWDLFFSTIRHYQPDALIADWGPDIRWVGNENGLAGETEWCIQPKGPINFGGDRVWYPSECDVSIRPGWFYHKDEDSYVKSGDELVDIYFNSVGRNSNLLLNVPPNKEGVFSEIDINHMYDFKNKLNIIFKHNIFANQKIKSSNTRSNSEIYSAANCLDEDNTTFWVTDKEILTSELIINLENSEKLNIIRLEEPIEYGQRIKSFSVFADQNDQWVKIFDGTTVGRSRIIRFNTVNSSKIRILINDSFASPAISEIKGYCSN